MELDVSGDPRQMPPGLDLSAFRIVQEALTNVLRHEEARPERWSACRYHAEALELSVSDDGPPFAATTPGADDDRHPAVDLTGHGLVGAPPSVRGRVVIRVVLADDLALVRAGFRMILHAEPGIEVVGEAPDGAAAVRLAP